MVKIVEGYKDGKPELGRRMFLVPETNSEVLAMLYHEQVGVVGELPVGPLTTEPLSAYGIRLYPGQEPLVYEEARQFFEKFAERFVNNIPQA